MTPAGNSAARVHRPGALGGRAGDPGTAGARRSPGCRSRPPPAPPRRAHPGSRDCRSPPARAPAWAGRAGRRGSRRTIGLSCRLWDRRAAACPDTAANSRNTWLHSPFCVKWSGPLSRVAHTMRKKVQASPGFRPRHLRGCSTRTSNKCNIFVTNRIRGDN